MENKEYLKLFKQMEASRMAIHNATEFMRMTPLNSSIKTVVAYSRTRAVIATGNHYAVGKTRYMPMARIENN